MIQNSQITKLTWCGILQPNYGGNTLGARAVVCASHILAGIATIDQYKCYTFNHSIDITDEFRARVAAAMIQIQKIN